MTPISNRTEYKAIIIGSGQGGKPLALALANAGWHTVLIERDQIGGTCVNYGCTPTKTMVASARVAHLARRAADYGVRAGDVSIDLKQVIRRKRAVVKSFRSGSEQSIAEADNLDLIRGDAKFIGQKEIEITRTGQEPLRISADTIVIDAGTRNSVPSIPGLDQITPLDSTSIMELDSVPEHLLIVGGGYIGLEFGQMFRRFGSKITIVQRADHLLDREDEDITEALADILSDEGVNIRLGASLQTVAKTGDGSVQISIKQGDRLKIVEATHLMLAVGRRPNTEPLGLEKAGVDINQRGFVTVNERLETNIPGIYAIGDVNGGPAFTHISYDDYRILEQNLLHHRQLTSTGRAVPYTLFTDPQLGRVGLSEKEAKKAGIPYRIAKIPMTHVARALEMDESRGFMKALIDPQTDLILGCAVLAVEGGELMALIQMAMTGGVTYQKLRDTILAHPTFAESLNTLFAAVED